MELLLERAEGRLLSLYPSSLYIVTKRVLEHKLNSIGLHLFSSKFLLNHVTSSFWIALPSMSPTLFPPRDQKGIFAEHIFLKVYNSELRLNTRSLRQRNTSSGNKRFGPAPALYATIWGERETVFLECDSEVLRHWAVPSAQEHND
jgi:hypothetical protein